MAGLSEGGYAIFTVLPGFWTYFALVMSWATSSSFAWRRTFLLMTLQSYGFLPQTEVCDAEFACHASQYRTAHV